MAVCYQSDVEGLGNLLQGGSETLSKADYLESLQIFARSPQGWQALSGGALHPDTGSFEGMTDTITPSITFIRAIVIKL